LEAKTLAEDYRIDDNSRRPHSALGYRTPASFAAEWALQPTGIT
jgi:transposase InsO family protein